MSNCAIQNPPSGLDAKPGADRQARRDARELHDEQEGRPVAEAPRRDQHADDVVGIAAQIVQQARKQHQAREGQHAHDEGDQRADREVAVEQQARVQERAARAVRQWATKIQNASAPTNAHSMISREFEPVQALAAVEDQLRGDDGDRQGDEPDPVEADVHWRSLCSASANQMQTSAQMPGGTIMKKAARQL